MAEPPDTEAWNNFVLRSKLDDFEVGSVRRSAAIAKLYMNLAEQWRHKFLSHMQL